ncbi:hypothetical protein ACLOJK_037180 [Asimina triloba]
MPLSENPSRVLPDLRLLEIPIGWYCPPVHAADRHLNRLMLADLCLVVLDGESDVGVADRSWLGKKMGSARRRWSDFKGGGHGDAARCWWFGWCVRWGRWTVDLGRRRWGRSLLEDFAAADRWVVCHGLEARIGAALMPSRCCSIGRCLLVGCDVDLTPLIRAAMGAP